jgi:heme A synthase
MTTMNSKYPWAGKAGAWFASTQFLILAVSLGILAGIISARSVGSKLANQIHIAGVVSAALLLLACVIVVIWCAKSYKIHRKKSLVLGPIGTTALVVGMLLNQMAPESKAVMVVNGVLLAISFSISVPLIIFGRREIARLKHAAAEREGQARNSSAV